jgi:hypothetical protein
VVRCNQRGAGAAGTTVPGVVVIPPGVTLTEGADGTTAFGVVVIPPGVTLTEGAGGTAPGARPVEPAE